MIRQGTPLSRLMALTCLGGLCLTFAATIVLPLSNWKRETREAWATSGAEAERLTRSIADLKTELATRSTDGLQDLTWTAGQLGEVTARIQAGISEIAQAHGGVVIRSIAPTGPRDLPYVDAVSFHLEIEAALDQLTEFLAGLEYHQPVLAVETATLRRLARPGPQTAQPLLFVQLDLIAPVTLPHGAGQ